MSSSGTTSDDEPLTEVICRSTIQAVVENNTDIEVTSLKMALEDNVTTYQMQRISGDDVSPQMMHELELDMQQLPVLQIDEIESYTRVGPNDKLAIAMRCRGKPGL